LIELHDFQRIAADQIESSDSRRIVLVAPTAAGKTVIASEVIRRAMARYERALVLAHRREIINQTGAKLTTNGVGHGVVMAGVEPRPLAPVQVASIDTLRARALNGTAMQMPPADLVIIDETHHARAQTYQKIIAAYPDAKIIGLTATPCRGDGRGLGNVFDTMIETPQIAELITLGVLVPSRVYAPVDPDLKGVKTQTGDYVVNQLSDRMNTDALVGDIVSDWFKHGERRKTVAFACSVAHSVHIRDEFLKVGVRAEHLHANTPTDERDAMLARLASGETEVVSNCMVLTEGWDCPPVGCLILARPTKQMGLYRQMIGRVLRTAPGKIDAIILDHSGAVFRHGLPEDPVEWTLDVDRRAANKTHERRKAGEADKLRTCPSCDALLCGPPPCWSCGWMPAPRARSIDFAEGELGLVIGGKVRAPEYTAGDRERWHAMLAHIAEERGYQRGWVAHQFKQKFGTWPAWGFTPEPIPPSAEVRSWVRSRMIAFAKRRSAAA
jgi:superfamily II DNA or RNA helicase